MTPSGRLGAALFNQTYHEISCLKASQWFRAAWVLPLNSFLKSLLLSKLNFLNCWLDIIGLSWASWEWNVRGFFFLFFFYSSVVSKINVCCSQLIGRLSGEAQRKSLSFSGVNSMWPRPRKNSALRLIGEKKQHKVLSHQQGDEGRGRSRAGLETLTHPLQPNHRI